jgi:hypothetical protein
MTDSIDETDLRRVDSNVDPTALTDDDIEDAMPDDFSDSAKQAFADRISDRRDAVQQSVDLDQRIDTNPLTGSAMVRNDDGQFIGKASNVEGTNLEPSGEYQVEFSDGSTETIAQVDIQAGNDGPAQRRDRGASNWAVE